VEMTCERCGTSIRESDAFCTKCGMRRDATAQPARPGYFCTKCGALLADSRFCTKCGAPAESLTVTPKAANSLSASEKQPSAMREVFWDRSTRTGDSLLNTAAVKPVPGLPKLLIVSVVGILLFAAAITAGVVYVAHRARQKVTELETDPKVRRKLADLKAATNSAGSGPSKSSSGANAHSSDPAAPGGAKPDAPNGWMLENGKLVPAPSKFAPTVSAPASSLNAPAAATGDQSRDWAIQYERTERGPEADLIVRTGDINNLGFGWPKNYDPFSGKSTYPHPFPWSPKPGSPDGTDRLLLGSAVTIGDYNKHPFAGDGYTGTLLGPCQGLTDISACKGRQDSMPQPIVLSVGALPPKVDAVLFQIFVDDFQAPSFHSHFQASLNGTRIPSLEQVLNALDQTGPIGKLITVNLLPEYFPLLNSGTVKLLIDDPTTHAQDGYAVDFVRILVNPHKFPYLVSVAVTVKDFDKNTPIAGATVTAAQQSASTDASGSCNLAGLPAGLVVATAVAPGYDANSATADVVAGQSGHAEIQLHRHQEDTAALERAIAQTGSAAIYGIHFDTDSAKIRPDSLPALGAVLALVNNHFNSRWIISGHTDNQGSAAHNQPLSEQRARAVIAWLTQHGVPAGRLEPQGFGSARPIADNATTSGRALNRRVEVAPMK
jgi:OOP family OmpA-OmpF porin